jgi:16S rRNA (guanine(966)-N(2))-methyltransferase RsmD
MRVIAGRLKGRRLLSPAGEDVRPTSDKLRETLFNVIAPLVPGAHVLDGYAGTGALGIEALSRGASSVTFVERDPRAVRLIRENLRHCGLEDGCVIIRADLASAANRLRDRKFDLVLLDPPYHGVDSAAAIAAAAACLADGGLVVFEHARRVEAPAAAGNLTRVRDLLSGDSALAFYRRIGEHAEDERSS